MQILYIYGSCIWENTGGGGGVNAATMLQVECLVLFLSPIIKPLPRD